MEERDPQLSEAYRAADHPEPSPALDARILDAARQAVAPNPRRRPTWRNWAVPLSTTAVLVLGITLLFKMQREAPDTLSEALPSPATARPDAAPPPTAGNQAESAAKPGPDEKTDKAAKATVASGAGRAAMQTAPSRPASGTAPQATAPASPGADLSSESAATAPAGLAPEPRPFPAQAAPALQAEPSRKAMPTPPAGNLGEERARMERSAPPLGAAREAAPAFGQGLGKLKAASPEREEPAQWVESIRRLVKEGRIDEARKSLEELRKRYPEFVLPEDLRVLADK
jgi:resuscitation-promoting factor RpfA